MMLRLSQRLQMRPQLPGRVNSGDYFGLGGGLNIVDPPVRVNPGSLLNALNYEPFLLGGYRSIGGYERFDGRRSPGRARLVNVIITDVGNNDLADVAQVSWNMGFNNGPVLEHATDPEDTILIDSAGELPEIGEVIFDPDDNIRAEAGNRLLLVGDNQLIDIAEDDKQQVGTAWTELGVPNTSYGDASVHPDGTIMAISQGGPVRRVRFYDTATGQRRDDWPTLINGASGAIRKPLWSPDGKRLVAAKQFTPPNSPTLSGYAVLDVATKSWTTAESGLPFHDDLTVLDMSWNQDSSRLAVVSRIGGGPVTYQVFDIENAEVLYTSDAGDYSRIEWVGDDSLMVLGGSQLIEVRDTVTGADLTADWPTFGGSWVPQSITRCGTRLAVVLSVTDPNPQLIIIDIATRSVESGWPSFARGGSLLAIVSLDWSAACKKLAVITVAATSPQISYQVIDAASKIAESGWPNPFITNQLANGIVWLDAPIKVVGSNITEDVQAAEVAFRESLRALIQPVPGSGPVRGVQDYGDVVIAFRDDISGDRQQVWRSSEQGWQQVRIDPYVRFDNGSIEIADGDTFEIVETGERFVARKVVTTSGFWSNGSQRGYIVYRREDGSESSFPLPDEIGIDPEIVGGMTIQSNGGVAAIADGDAQEHIIRGGAGFRQNHIYNFEGKTPQQSLYSIDGRNFCIRYDRNFDIFGEIVMPIITGMPEDTPTSIAGHHGMLFLGYPNGSLQNSGINQPFSYNIVAGAAEQLVGDEIVALLPEINDALLIYSRDRIDILYGRTPDQFQRGQLSYEVGAKSRTVQRLGRGIHMDLGGFTTLQATEQFGDFASASISERIKPLIGRLRDMDAVSQINRELSVYRIWFEDGTGLSLGFTGNDPTGFVPIRYNVPVRCVNDAKNPSRPERLFFGSDDGFVYEQDVGTSFDGEDIESFLFMVFNHSGSPANVKHYRKVTLDMATNSRLTMWASATVNFGATSGNIPAADIGQQSFSNSWGQEQWNKFEWSLDAGIITPSFTPEVSGHNLSIYLHSKSNLDRPHIVSGVQLHWSRRRIKREFT